MTVLLYLVSLVSLLYGTDAMSFTCVNGNLYFPNGNKEWVGSCDSGVIGGSHACVNGSLYFPSGSKEWVSSCDSAVIGGSHLCHKG